MNTLKFNENPPHWLIIQLARFGDLMQTAPILAGAVRMNPPPRVDLLVPSDLSDLAQTLPGVNQVFGLARSKWLQLFDDLRISWAERARILRKDLEPLATADYDRVINLTHTPESGCIAAVVRAGRYSGLKASRSQQLASDPAERYFQAILPRRSLNGFHLIDIHRRQAETPPAADLYQTVKPSLVKPRKGRTFRIALQLGANSELRRWPVEKYAAVLDKVQRRTDCEIILLGAAQDLELGQRFEAVYSGKVVSVIGKTSLVELGEVLGSCDILLSGDTGTAHLAAVRGIPVAAVFLAQARASDTAPYGAGHTVLCPKIDCYPCPENRRCPNPVCGETVDIDLTAQVVFNYLSNTEPPSSKGSSTLALSTGFDKYGDFNLFCNGKSALSPDQQLMRDLLRGEDNGGVGISSEGLKVDFLTVEERNLIAKLGVIARETKPGENKYAPSGADNSIFDDIIATIEELANAGGFVGFLTHLFALERAYEMDACGHFPKMAFANLARRARQLTI